MELESMKERMQVALDVVLKDFSSLRTGRASTSLLDSVRVDVYGASTPLNQVSNLSVLDAKTLSIQIWDKSNIKAVEKAISESGLGLNPLVDGTLIRVTLPDLTQERRKELGKVASKYAEQGRVALRNIRRDGMDALKKQEKDGDLSKDEAFRLSEEIQKITDGFVKKVDEALAQKEKDILQI